MSSFRYCSGRSIRRSKGTGVWIGGSFHTGTWSVRVLAATHRCESTSIGGGGGNSTERTLVTSTATARGRWCLAIIGIPSIRVGRTPHHLLLWHSWTTAIRWLLLICCCCYCYRGWWPHTVAIAAIVRVGWQGWMVLLLLLLLLLLRWYGHRCRCGCSSSRRRSRLFVLLGGRGHHLQFC